ncbi:SET domain-containing protein 5 [Cytospora mali]|uniref:SET domain-containing protein 5 n=1 Tax=Cytospora mali TaxID=578113 RepID=A0A194V594_CYTMA|nr:SET domain-containing protein 5 [Valsa mali var. pyri (nom. inval.)]
MGIDAGFDMVPRLSRGIVDKQNWDSFINQIKELYKDDAQVEIKPNYIVFKAGEHPKLPLEGHKFLRFSSKISGRIASETRVESYINAITRVARARFGFRIQYWNECADQHGYYDWNEVHESVRSYEQPDEVEIPTSISHALTGIDPYRELDIPLFEVKDVPGKGKGLVARLNISKGTQVLCEKPLLTVASGPPPNQLEPMLAAKLKALPRTKQREFLSLHNNFPGKFTFTGIVRTNALPCGPGSIVGGVYPTICLINHNCLPNAHNSWDSNREHETIYAIRPIKAGEEITIAYDHGGPAAARRAFLKKAFGFDCECSICTLPPAELQASDARRLLIQRLDDEVGDPFRMAARPGESLRNCHSLLKALEEEFDGHTEEHSARLYYDAFQICIAHVDEARASVFAEKAYKARIICEGEDSPETQRVKSFSLKPSDHVSFGQCSTNWKTTRKMVPKGLNVGEFEKWLFRQQA